MQSLSDISTVKKILSRYGFTFSKAIGQNFLVDPSVCPRMAEMSGINKEYGVIEIGPGIGVLTRELAMRAERVVAVELDTRLKPVLDETLAGLDNVEVVFADFMKTDIKALTEEKLSGLKTAVCANLPYYITSDIIMSVLESRLPIESITAMVQKEAGERLAAKVGTRKSGAVTAAVDYYSSAKILFNVGRECFIPSPKVDSCVIKLDVRKSPQYAVKDERLLFSVIKSGFSKRRKTISNSVAGCEGISKDKVTAAAKRAGISPLARIEELDMQSLCRLADEIWEETKNV